jgi:hypothetical protein
MRKKKVWRYYCDFCKKSGCSAGHMKRHEIGCTGNPNRVCGLCEVAEKEQPAIADLIAAAQADADNHTDPDGLCSSENLRTVANGCPACMLTGARQSGRDSYFDFDYKAEHSEFWKNVNDARCDGAAS